MVPNLDLFFSLWSLNHSPISMLIASTLISPKAQCNILRDCNHLERSYNHLDLAHDAYCLIRNIKLDVPPSSFENFEKVGAKINRKATDDNRDLHAITTSAFLFTKSVRCPHSCSKMDKPNSLLLAWTSASFSFFFFCVLSHRTRRFRLAIRSYACPSSNRKIGIARVLQIKMLSR